jgi:ketosteroid isomerase-like protein
VLPSTPFLFVIQLVVLALYDALSTCDVATVHQIVAADLEWWFHGPPSHQFFMRLLTDSATASASSFTFIPQSITSFRPTVLVEGCDRDGKVDQWRSQKIDVNGHFF